MIQNWLTSPKELEHVLKEADALILRNRTQVRGVVLSSAKKLKAVGRLGVGMDNIDTETCTKARGGVVDEKALIAAMGQKFKRSNLILTPHIAGVTQESNIRVSEMTAANIRKALTD